MVLYDVDPHTLAPDTSSLLAALHAGASMVVVTHLFGRIVNVPAIQALARPFGAVVIEDAAQHAGGTLRGIRGGAFGDYAVLSFGRGKGLNAAGGGALLTAAGEGEALPTRHEGSAVASLKALTAAIAGELMAHPRVYWLPAQIPQLKLGETVYHPPTPAAGISATSLSLLEFVLTHEAQMLGARRTNETWYQEALHNSAGLLLENPPPDVCSGALRFPVLVEPSQAAPLARLGVARSYPRLLRDYPEIARHCVNASDTLSGASALATRLHTLPTHALVTAADRQRIVDGLLTPQRYR
jgi:dTDP-4-amino-4,6-dideoxygalactose transaminase